MEKTEADNVLEKANLLEHMEKLRIKVLYTNEVFIDNMDDVMLTTFKPSEMLISKCLSKHDYSDLPPHWEYLENTLLLQKYPFPEATEIIIVEKYKNVAIGYNHFYSKRPVAVFRENWKNFKSIKLGDILVVELEKMYVHVEKCTFILTDLYATPSVTTSCQPFHYHESSVKNDRFLIFNFTFRLDAMERIGKYFVLFADFGAIVVPKKFCKILCSKECKGAAYIGYLKYCITMLNKYQGACWKLGKNFTIYRDTVLYAHVTDGEVKLVRREEKKPRLSLIQDTKVINMVKSTPQKKKTYFYASMTYDYANLDDFISFSPERKRTQIRKY